LLIMSDSSMIKKTLQASLF